MKSLASPVFNLKALEFGAFFACFRLFRYNFSKIVPKHLVFNKLSTQKKPFEDSPSGFKISF